jgi:hypothetical protein
VYVASLGFLFCKAIRFPHLVPSPYSPDSLRCRSIGSLPHAHLVHLDEGLCFGCKHLWARTSWRSPSWGVARHDTASTSSRLHRLGIFWGFALVPRRLTKGFIQSVAARREASLLWRGRPQQGMIGSSSRKTRAFRPPGKSPSRLVAERVSRTCSSSFVDVQAPRPLPCASWALGSARVIR